MRISTLSHSHTHTHTLTHTHILTLTHTYSHTHTHSHSQPLTHSHRLSEKGILQLLFDVRLLHDVLAPTPPTTAPRGTPHPPSGPQWGALESQLAGELDPIDWATYESHVWANEGRYYQRCHVLFGNLIQLQRLHGDITIKVDVGGCVGVGVRVGVGGWV